MKALYWLWIVLLAAGCARAEATPTAIVQPLPVSAAGASALAGAYEPADCPPSRFGGGQRQIECGWLSVPLDRAQVEGETMKIAVTIIRASASARQPDPVVFVSYSGSGAYAFAARDLLLDRDLVIADLRGAGRSEPALTCPGVAALAGQMLSLPPYSPETLQQVLAEQRTCYQGWLSQGLDLRWFSSAAAAADLEDLRQALGYERWNVYAAGYGARVALLLMRDFPQPLRSVVIESPTALVGADLADLGANLDRALNLFFDSCAADAACNEAFPELKTVFYEVVDHLNAQPIPMEVADLNAGKRYQVLLDGDRLIDVLTRAVASGNAVILPEMPRAIYQLKSGQFDTLARLLGGMISGFGYSANGVQWQTECLELLPQTSRERILQGTGALPLGLHDYLTRQYALAFNTCDLFKDVPPTPELQQIAPSSVPTLFLLGDRSPSSAPQWAHRAAASLGSAKVVEISGSGSIGGFDRSRSACSRAIAAAFFADPLTTPDTTCAAEQPAIPWITLP